MKISAAGIKLNTFKPCFKSIRTDKYTIGQLKTGEKPIIDNNKQNIYSALNNLSARPDRSNIEFLLDVASNLQYGQGSEDSEFKKALDSEGITPEERENTSWSQILDDTIRRAIASSDEDVSDLETEYEKICGKNNKLTPEQQKILDLRKELTCVIVKEAALYDEQALTQAANIRKNLDYFTASSEIPLKQKQECLEKILYFMSDDYKINPQLEDKKLQVVEEMLNDMLIKTPEREELTIKSVNQRQSGICAAISICRKAIAYEDKTRFVEMITEELQDSPVMSVFDVTDLESGKKVDIQKTDINYTSAMEKGYRIIDASAHNWMHNAHASGDGSLQTEHYIAFDGDDNYGIYDDTSWYLGLPDSINPEKVWLQALIKEKEFLKSFYKTKKEMFESCQNIAKVKKEVYASESSSLGRLNTVFTDIFPEKSNKELSAILTGLLKFYMNSDGNNEINVSSKHAKETKQDILSQYLSNSVDGITEEQKDKIKEKSKSIYLMTDEYAQAELKLKKLTKYNSPKSKYIYNKKLYNLASAHRLAIEAEVNIPGNAAKYERLTDLPPRDIQIADYLKSLRKSFQFVSVREKYIDENGEIPSAEILEKELNSDLIKIETVIPSELDYILQNLTGQNSTEIVSSLYSTIADQIENNDIELSNDIKLQNGIKGDKKSITAYMRKWAEKLSDKPDRKDFLEAIRLLGYENQLQFTYTIISSFISSLSDGITENDCEELAKRFGGKEKISSGIEEQRIKFNELSSEYFAINEKWQIPSSSVNILSRLEKQHCVLSRKKLNTLKNKFDSIYSGMIKNEQTENVKERQKANNKLYKFNNEENDIFNYIEKMLPYMKKYCNTGYKELNEALYEDLEKQYSDIGMLNGQFWVREEGSTGLSVNEQIRIIEQMTGKPYHMETDIFAAAEQIKEGNGSGIISLSVDDSDYAFHAMYVPSVTSETFIEPAAKEKIIKEIIWMDNSWGEAEREHYWKGNNGYYYTDYNSGYGWKNGFILSPDNKIGLPVKDIAEAIGVEQEDNDEFGLFSDMVLPGMPVNAYQKLYKMFTYILDINEGEKLFTELERNIADGKKFSIKELEGLDSVAESKADKLEKRINKEIKTEADFAKLPDDDELKFLFKKLSVYLSTENPFLADTVLTVKNYEELEEAVNEIVEENINGMAALLGKSDAALENLMEYVGPEFEELFNCLEKDYSVSISETQREKLLEDIFFNEEALKNHDGSLMSLETYLSNQVIDAAVKNIEDEDTLKFFIENAQRIILENIDKNIKIKSLEDDGLVSSPLFEKLIAAADKYLHPASDEELLALLQGLQMADYDTSNAFFEALEPEDAGVYIKEPYYYVVQYKTGNGRVTKAFSEVVSTQEIYSYLEGLYNRNHVEQETDTPEELYRALYVKLSDMDVQEYIKAFKAEAFQKYKVRQAFPQPIVIPDDKTEETVIDMLSVLREHSDNIENSKYILQILDKFSKMHDKYSSEPFYSDLMSFSDVKITDENIEKIKSFKALSEEISSLISDDDTLISLNNALNELIMRLDLSCDTIDGQKAGNALNKINSIFSQIYSSGADETNFIQLQKEEMKAISDNVKIMVNANIKPKYRDEAFKKVYQYINLYRKGADEDTLAYAEDELACYFADKHIIKTPAVLLRECVQLLLDGKSSSDEYQIMKEYLLAALKVAQQTKIQYKLVQNQHEGISSKTKDLLPMFNVVLSDGSTVSMDSEPGMLYLVEQLGNQGDNYTILNLFLEQSGLSKQALKALINNFDTDKTREFIDTEINKIIDGIQLFDKLAELVFDFVSMSDIKYKSIEEEIKHLSAFIKRKLPDYKEVQIYDSFINYLDSLVYSDNQNAYSGDMINVIAAEVSKDALYYIADIINSQINYAESINQMLNERYELLNSIRVPVNCEEYNMRNKFFQSFEEIQNYFVEKCTCITEAVNKSNFINNLRDNNA